VTKHLLQVLLLACFTAPSIAGAASGSRSVARAETIYGELDDASSVIAAIDSGLFTSYGHKGRSAWEQIYRDRREQLVKVLAKMPSGGLSETDARVVTVMRSKLDSLSESAFPSVHPPGHCQDALNKDLDYAVLRRSLVACFVEIGNNLSFEDSKINRVSALDLFHQTEEPERRKALFLAFVPLWQALNGKNEPDSPYRRMMAMAAADATKHGSEIDAAARTVGLESAEVERWLEQILEAWRQVGSAEPVEPWDFRYLAGEADRLLASAIPRESLQPINQRYYRDLGADLAQLGVLYDLDPRPGKTALAYTEFLIHGRMVHGIWQPTIARVSATYARGGLFVLNELVHENGHAVHISAIRNRPAFVDWNDDLFVEAFADVPSWSTYEPAWQRRYLGREAPEAVSLRALYASVMLDVAWALFELRMLRVPATDPNALWTDITSRYLHIAPHPELSWWAVRVQLVDLPGYMVNYGFGAVLTADMRQHIREALGPFDTGDPRWYPWLSEHLLRYGSERDTRALLQEFLGRPVSPQALLSQIHRLAPPNN
jgi:hypothetical protein